MDPLESKTHASPMETAKPWTQLGRTLKALRVQRNLSQAQLAEKAGLDQRTVSLLERGESQPTLPTLYRLCSALELSLMAFVRNIEDAKKHNTL